LNPKKNTIKDKEAYIESPFRIEGINERFIHKKSKMVHAQHIVDTVTGEALPIYTPEQSIKKINDQKIFAKVFKEASDVILSLTDSTKSLFLYCASHLQMNKDTVWLSPDDCIKHCRFSKGTYYKCLVELIDKKVLARKLGSYLEYWVNPNIMFNGSRIKLLKTNNQLPTTITK
jgi:hypothetical protein